MRHWKTAAMAAVIGLLTGCFPCTFHEGSALGDEDGGGCDLLGSYNTRCHGESPDDPENNQAYYDAYRTGFCATASAECLAKPDVADFCAGVIDTSPASGT